MNRKITPKSCAKVIELLTPPTAQTGLEERAPRGLTIRALMCHQKNARLRTRFTIARIEGGHLVSLGNLEKLGFDVIG
jgi:hypothetical protein